MFFFLICFFALINLPHFSLCTVIRFLVRVSYLEIYNEEVRDLLGKDQTAHLDVKERPDTGVYVKDLSGFVVNNADDMDRIMNVGNKNRKYCDIVHFSSKHYGCVLNFHQKKKTVCPLVNLIGHSLSLGPKHRN